MFEITWQDVLDTAIDGSNIYGAFTPRQQNLILDEVHLRVGEVDFLHLTFHARRWFAAHKAAITVGPSAGEGTTSSQSVGGVAVGVTLAVNNPASDKNIESTVYGREYVIIAQGLYQGIA